MKHWFGVYKYEHLMPVVFGTCLSVGAVALTIFGVTQLVLWLGEVL